MESEAINNVNDLENEQEIDPIHDIIDYLVRCAKISFKNAHINESEVRTCDKIEMACKLFDKSPTNFLLQFGKYLTINHLVYFENLQPPVQEKDSYTHCITQLKTYHSDKSKHKRVRNRRYKALQRLQEETDYFSEKQMMQRNPLLYDQLVGQFLSDEEVRERDGVDRENLTFLNMILETVDRNDMRQMKNEQMLEEDAEINHLMEAESDENYKRNVPNTKKHWGDFDIPDKTPSFTPEVRKQSMISAPERNILRQEFMQEMYNSFIEGIDTEVDYNDIDNDEQYDDLHQESQDAEDKYFDSESNEVENLEEHMKLVAEYSKKNTDENVTDDPLDVFMKHISIKH